MATDRPRLTLAGNAIPGRGGQGINLSQMISGLGEAFDLTVFSRGSAPGFRSETTAPSRMAALVGALPLLRRMRDKQTSFEDVAFDSQVAARIPDCAIFQGVTGQCLATLERLKARGTVTVLDSITAHIDEFARVGRRECDEFGFRFPIDNRMQSRMRKEYEVADVIRVMSDYAKSTFLDRGFNGDRIVVAEPHYDVETFPNLRPRTDTLSVCYLGALEPWKGFHILVDAFEKLQAEDAELRLWGGSGSHKVTEYLDKLLNTTNRVYHSTIDVRYSGYGRVFEGASVVVLPSLSDGFGQVVAEAMACGIPAIVTSSSGASSLVEDGVNGFVVPPGNPEAIFERLEHLSRDRAVLDPMGQAARQTVALYDLQRFQDKYTNALLGVLHSA